ncbi:hypothetical protein J6590_030770 [Homalodisca vitripennis]|nr:hypothetical protein J6590_030770 [Homalodisca vitripennis]
MQETHYNKKEPLEISHHCKELVCEVAMLRIAVGKQHLYVIGIYRSPREKLNEALDILSNIIEETKAENHPTIIMVCPKKKTRNKRNPNFNYKDCEALRLKETYLQCLRKYQTTGNDLHKTETALAKKNYDLRLKMLKRQASSNCINRAENKSKAIWQIVNSERKSTDQGKEQLKMKINGEETTNPNEIAEKFNEFFTQVAQQTLVTNNQLQKGRQLTLHVANCRLTQLHNTTTEEV